MPGKRIFVTVGTTKFDELIRTILNSEILEALSTKGYNELILQIGKSSILPDCTPRCNFLKIEYFQLCPSIEDYVASADLVISHAGAGSILEALDAKKPLVVVTNNLLMDNHQLELAEQLFIDGHLLYCTCETLHDTIKTMDLTQLKPFVDNRSKTIARFVDKAMGFS